MTTSQMVHRDSKMLSFWPKVEEAEQAGCEPKSLPPLPLFKKMGLGTRIYPKPRSVLRASEWVSVTMHENRSKLDSNSNIKAS